MAPQDVVGNREAFGGRCGKEETQPQGPARLLSAPKPWGGGCRAALSEQQGAVEAFGSRAGLWGPSLAGRNAALIPHIWGFSSA